MIYVRRWAGQETSAISFHAFWTDRRCSSGSSSKRTRALDNTADAASLVNVVWGASILQAMLPGSKAVPPYLRWRVVVDTTLGWSCVDVGGGPKWTTRAAAVAGAGCRSASAGAPRCLLLELFTVPPERVTSLVA